MDYYSTLGLQRGATDADIKKAYRSMAMKHHPDRGGDEKKFKEISQAYEFLSDPQKKQMIDSGIDPNQQHGGGGFYHQGGGNPFEFHFGGNPGMDDIFTQFGFGFRNQQMRRNRTLNVNVEITLEDVLTGKELNAEISVPGGRKKIVNVSIPPGVQHGQQIRYTGMGDDSIPGVPPGDLILNVYIKHHALFQREGDELITEKRISTWDAILGASIDVVTVEGKTLTINVPIGTQPDTILSCKGEGIPNMRTRHRGNLLIKIKIEIPRNLTAQQLEKLKEIRDGI
jgi:DnaJ-class molecular chaperone